MKDWIRSLPYTKPILLSSCSLLARALYPILISGSTPRSQPKTLSRGGGSCIHSECSSDLWPVPTWDCHNCEDRDWLTGIYTPCMQQTLNKSTIHRWWWGHRWKRVFPFKASKLWLPLKDGWQSASEHFLFLLCCARIKSVNKTVLWLLLWLLREELLS